MFTLQHNSRNKVRFDFEHEAGSETDRVINSSTVLIYSFIDSSWKDQRTYLDTE